MKVNRFRFDEDWTVAEEYVRLRNMGENRQKIVCVHTQSCMTFCKPMDCSLLGSSLHGIFQARILEWIATSYSRGSSQPRDWTRVSCISCTCRWILHHQGTSEVQEKWSKPCFSGFFLAALCFWKQGWKGISLSRILWPVQKRKMRGEGEHSSHPLQPFSQLLQLKMFNMQRCHWTLSPLCNTLK